MKIEVVEKSYYGNLRYKIANQGISRAVMNLTHKKTIGEYEIAALKELGFTIVLKETKEKKL